MTTLDDLKKSRSASKAKVTKLVNKVKPLLELTNLDASRKAPLIKTLIDDLDEALKQFQAAHEAYVEQLFEEDGEAANEDKYEEDVESNYWSAKELYPEFLQKLTVYNNAVAIFPNQHAAYEDSINKLKTTVSHCESVLNDAKDESKVVPSLTFETALKDLAGHVENIQLEKSKYSAVQKNMGHPGDASETVLNFDMKAQLDNASNIRKELESNVSKLATKESQKWEQR